MTEEAVQFAGIQCQVQYGDFQEDKHKPGYIENLSEFLPQQYASSWGVEKKVLREHSQHVGVSPIDAKHLYTKTARDLPTYGVTFFLVKEMQKGKKKLVPRLLGISANAILRLDETTKEVLQVWPLTQVKTYKAGKGELFTLNFGDYSEKEYCVKTNDAYRIRDILQSYIDLIRKKMAGPYNPHGDEGGVVYSATVESSKSQTMEVVSHSSNKVVESSFVGPSKIISYESGSTVQSQGAQVMTAQQVIVTSRQHNEQTAATGGVAMRGEMSVNTVRKLNDLNGNAVCIVKLLTEPTEANIEEAKKIVEVISQNMPVLVEGVKQHIEKQPDEPARKKLTFELSELTENVDQLTKFKTPSDAQEAAMRVADLTTQMYFALDPRSKRNSKILRHSRKSFIEDDRTQATIHRASLINSVAAANNAIDDAKDILNKKYTGPALSPKEIEDLERSARDRLAKLNAAIALFTAAHADPKNIDYGATVNSMNTIKELMPELAKEAHSLSGAGDGRDRSALLQEMWDFCDAAARISQNTGCEDPQKLHDEANNFAKKSGRLIFTFGRGVHPDKENEIINLAKEADDKASLLMATAGQLAGEVDDPGAEAAARAAARCGHAARGLRACAQLTASSIHEPHCRSALSAASEDLKSSAKVLTDACRPLLEHPEGRSRSEALARQSAELSKALERLENAYSELDGKSDTSGSQEGDRERQRLQFVTTLSKAQDALDCCDKMLKDDTKSPASTSNGSAGWYKLAELNAAIASLVAATRDGENPDYAAADEALAVIEKSLPDFVKESKAYSQKLPPQRRAEFLREVQDLCGAARALALDTRHGEEASASVAEFARASGKLTYILDKHAQVDKEHEIIDLAKSSCAKTSELLAHVYGLAADLQGEAWLADQLDAKGSRVAEAAQELLTTAQLTAPTIHTAPCKRALVGSAQALTSALEDVAQVWSEACQPNHLAEGQVLNEHKKIADAEIQRLIDALRNLPEYEVPKDDPVKAKKRVQFATSLSHARDAVEQAEMEINKASPARQLSAAQVTTVRRSLSDKLATLNAAIASLMAATQDPYNPNFEAAQSSSAVIQQVVPQLVQDTKALSGNTDEKERAELLDELRALCAAAKDISAGVGDGNTTEMNKAVAQYAKAAGKLSFICTPQTQGQEKQRKVLDRTQAVCDKSSELMAVIEQLKKPGTSDAELEGPKLKAQQAAQALRTTAQLTAPSLHATQCRTALHEAASDLSHAVAELGNACGPKVGQAGLQRIVQQRKEFDKAVEELMRTIKDLEGDTQAEEKRRLKFMGTQAVLDKAARQLNEPVKSSPLTPSQAEALQSSLSARLATLNAAIAALTGSTRDPSNVNFEVVESSTAIIQELVPQLVQESKTLSGGMDQKERAQLLGELQALCAAAKTLSSGGGDGNSTEMNKAVDQYAKAASRLSFICTPQKQAQAKQRKVLEKTQALCDKSSELLATVQQLKKPGSSDAALEGPRLKAQQAAQALLTTAQLTAPTLHATECRFKLHQAASDLSHAVTELGDACGPQLGQARMQRLVQQRKAFEEAVEELMRTMEDLDSGEEKRRLKFTTTQAVLDKAASELNKPIRPSSLTLPQAKALQSSLSDRLASLNAAIAALISSNRDDNKPDYAAAVTATIQELVPDFIQDSRILAGGLDEAGQDNLMQNLHALCNATKVLSSGQHNGKEEEMNEAVERFTKASGKLAYTFNPNANYVLQDQIIDLTKSTCLKTSELLANVYDLAEQVRGPKGEELDVRGAKVADAAQDLLTTAEITAPSINSPLCRSSCIAAVDALDSSTQELALAWQSAASHTKTRELETAKAKVVEELAKLREALKSIKEQSDADFGTESGETQAKAERMRFVTSFALTEAALEAAKKELDKPTGTQLPATEVSPMQNSLARRLGDLNAIVGSIVATPRDQNKVNYAKAHATTMAIRHLVPDIVRDTKTLSSSMEPAARDEMLAQTHTLCDATLRICADAIHSPEEMNKAVPQYSQATDKLNFVFNPNFENRKAQQIMGACESTCVKTSDLMKHVRALAKDQGPPGQKLEEKGQAVCDAAKTLLTAAQLTAPSADSIQCQAVLFDASHQVSASLKDLESATKSSHTLFHQHPGFKASLEQTVKGQAAVEAELVQLRALLPAVKETKGKKPAVPVRSGSLKRRKAAAAGSTADFMDEMRSALIKENADGGHDPMRSPTSPRSANDKQAKTHFSKCVELARQTISKSEDDLKKTLSSPGKSRASLDDAEVAALNRQMEHKLARANAAAAHLLACRGSQKPDYQLASKCVVAVSDLLPTIVTDAKTLADLKDTPSRAAFMDDTMGLCTASKNLCDTAKNDKKKLTEAALLFGNQTSKLLYAVSTDVDPSQENDVLVRVKAVGDVACRVTAVADGAEEQDAAVQCAAQATVFMYTAKLVAPSIQDPECQDSLITASKDLSAQLKVIPTTNRPGVAKELTELEKLLEALRRDVAEGKLVKKRERLVIEDTPLRRLTAQVIEDAKRNAECTSRPADERRAMADFANQLSDALNAMDLANARCKNAPHDMKRRAELEDAVLNVQHLVLQCRPRQGASAAQNNIVDLAVFLSDASSAAQQLSRSANAAGQAGGPHARAAAAVAAQSQELADALGGPEVDVDYAAKECASRVQKINTTIECCAESPEKSLLRKEARPLNESNTLLQFASQSSIATTQCAAIDEALNDLTELEQRIDAMLHPREGERRNAVQAPSPALLSSRARLATAAAGARRSAQELAPAFTRYVADMRASVDVADENKRRRLADHLKKLHDRLRLLTMETGRQVATWRPENQGEVVAITEDILKELDNAEDVIEEKSGPTKSHIAYEDLKKLLLPVNSYKVEGDKKQLEAKLESTATKLNSMSETITLSGRKPESLARTAHLTAETALQLSAIAKSMKFDQDPTKHNRIEEASQELCFVTYNLLKTAESACHEPDSFGSRRRLQDACRSLTDAINKLVRTASTADKLQRDCNELSRSLQQRQSSLQPRPTCTLPYGECVAALQTQHAAIENLKSDKPMSRQEFSSSLDLLTSAVSNNAEYAEQCAYLLSISEQHPTLAKEGLFDTVRVRRLIAAAEETCFRVMRPGIEHQATEESSILSKQLSDLKQVIQECSSKVTDATVKKQLIDSSSKVYAAGVTLQFMLNEAGVSVDKLTPAAFAVIDALSPLRAAADHPSLAPLAAPSAPAQQRADEVINQTKELLTRSTALMRVVRAAESQEAMTWVMFNTYTKGVIESSEQLVTCIRNNGQNSGLIEGAIEVDEEADLTTKSYVQTQALIANKWLHKPSFKSQIKTDGEMAAKNVIEVGKKMMEHLKGSEREEMRHLVEECEQLLKQCSAKYDLETGSVLMDRLKDLAKSIDRCVVNMVVEDLIEDEEPMADLEILIDAERDEAKRKFVLERKIKDLLAHLGRVTKTARVVADGHAGEEAKELRQCSEQASLLAPMLVKAAEKRVIQPTEKAVVEEYQSQLAQYSQSLSRVRDLCDRAVDPMQFVQTAEETMQRMKEESAGEQNDLLKCSNTSIAIRKLAHRVINVSISSPNAQRDPELMRALTAAQQRLRDAEPARVLRASKLPDLRNNIAEILRATGEVESVLGGEMIFKKLPEPDQPIYNAARNLHAAVREWSARDNEIVAVAKRSAVLMAKLSDHMHADKKREVLSTSKAIVAASHEVARLARKLALECTDMRIRTNLLQVCDQIPTISGQLKMLTTVKGSSLGHQGTEEDIEAMNMLVGNAQNLMMSIQDVVNAAAGASVKIRSQRGGPRMRWVRKNYQ